MGRLILAALFLMVPIAAAGEADVLDVEFILGADGTWRFDGAVRQVDAG